MAQSVQSVQSRDDFPRPYLRPRRRALGQEPSRRTTRERERIARDLCRDRAHWRRRVRCSRRASSRTAARAMGLARSAARSATSHRVDRSAGALRADRLPDLVAREPALPCRRLAAASRSPRPFHRARNDARAGARDDHCRQQRDRPWRRAARRGDASVCRRAWPSQPTHRRGQHAGNDDGRGPAAATKIREPRMMLLSLPLVATLATAAVAVDKWLGEPRRAHPLVGFGKLAAKLEAALNTGRRGRLFGILAWLLAVAPPVLIATWLVL